MALTSRLFASQATPAHNNFAMDQTDTLESQRTEDTADELSVVAVGLLLPDFQI